MSAITRTPGRVLIRFACGVACSVAAVATLAAGGAASAQPDPSAPTSYTQPLTVTNTYCPVVPGAVKVYSGTERGVALVVVESHLRETRDFPWNGSVVSCRVVERLTFRDGIPAGREREFLAQGDDGAVWIFGNVDDEEDDEDDGADEPGGWIVGERTSADPADVVTGARPMVRMPATPVAGDRWQVEDAPPSFVESARAEGTRDTVRTAAGRHPACLRVVETDASDPRPDTKWFAPGVGLVRKRGDREIMTLRASTIHAGPGAAGR